MYDVFREALIDSVKMVPWLLVIYIGIELVEYKFGHRIIALIQKAGAAGPAVGALAGSLPQCGISVVATALYTQRLATIGTLLAVYLSTSDEALPIILSQPDSARLILPLVSTKIFIAVVAGYALDLVFRKSNQSTFVHIDTYARGQDDRQHNHSIVLDGEACCGHSTSSSAKKFSPREIFVHPDHPYDEDLHLHPGHIAPDQRLHILDGGGSPGKGLLTARSFPAADSGPGRIDPQLCGFGGHHPTLPQGGDHLWIADFRSVLERRSGDTGSVPGGEREEGDLQGPGASSGHQHPGRDPPSRFGKP